MKMLLKSVIFGLFVISCLVSPVRASTKKENVGFQQFYESLYQYENNVNNVAEAKTDLLDKQIIDLTKERNEYYSKFFINGLHSTLSSVESEFFK